MSNLLKGLLISFYFREVEKSDKDEFNEGKENFIIEFFHKSLQEYMTAKHIYKKMSELIKKVERGKCSKTDEETMNIIWELFSHKPISEEIRGYLREIIEEKDLEERKELAERLKELFPTLLEVDFVVKPDELRGTFPLYKPFYTFRNFWIFAKMLTDEVSYTDELSYDLRQRFADFIRYVQSSPKTFIPAISLNKTDLEKIDLSGTNLEGASLREAKLTEANLRRIDLWGADLQEVDLRKAELQRADLLRANLEKSNLEEANLKRAKIQGANMGEAKLQKADLWGADLWRASLQNANLQKANLQRTDLWGANLQGCNFQEADLQNADIEEANLQNANMKKANLTNTDVKKAINWEKAIYDEEQKKLLGLK
jgi:uncharacterized protein YjbI with pentapeptide repeats